MIQHTILDDMPHKLIAILRGIETSAIEEAIPILVDAGFSAIEIPLNSPNAFESIAKAVKVAERLSASPILIGAGTVLNPEDVTRVFHAGGQLIISPNVDKEVIETTLQYNMLSIPGVFTASEALLAVACGAHMLKMFPSSVLGASGIAAIREVLPKGTRLCAVGGIGADEIADYRKKDIQYFGLGSSLYKAGMSSHDIAQNAKNIVRAYQNYS